MEKIKKYNFKWLFAILLLIVINSSAFVIHIKSPFSGSNLYIYGSNEFGWEGSPTKMASEGDGWFSVSTSSNNGTSNLNISDAVTWPKSTVSLGTVSSLFSGYSSSSEIWVTMTTSGVKSITDVEPNSTDNDTTVNDSTGLIDTTNSRVISAIIRDQAADGVEFQGGSTGHITGMVQDTLSSEGKLLKGSVNAKSANLESWFVDKNDNDTCIYMVWKRNADGYWEYNSNDYGGFFPIDNFNHVNNSIGSLGHNFHFTMEIHTQFEYREGSAQVFEFSGDDDVWVFVNNKLAIDIGGIHGPVSGSVNLDNSKSTLGLKNGENYALDIFFCERQTTGSNFRARTSIDIYNDVNIFYDSVKVSSTEIKYDIHEYDIVESELCGFNINNPDADTVAASVDFFIEGTQFGSSQKLLSLGLNYGGIKVIGDNAVLIDTAKVSGLTPGNYTITFVSKTDADLSGEIKFTISEETNDSIVLAKATLNVTPGDVIYNDTTIIVNLSTNSGNIIVYELLSFDSTVLSGPDTISVAGTVTIVGDMILKAIAMGNGYENNEGMWYYDSEIPQLEIKSSLENGSQFQLDTTVFLHAEVDSDTIDEVKIYYFIDKGDSLSVFDSTSGIPYNSEMGIVLDETVKIHAVAYKSGYNYGANTWIYKIDLLDIKITVSPSDSNLTYFGESIEKISISIDYADSVIINWIIDTVSYKNPLDFSSYGSVYNDNNSYPFISKNSNDTMYLSVMVTGQGFDTTWETYKYVRLYLPEIKANPYSSKGYKFSDEINAELKIEDPSNLFKNVRIYYAFLSDTSEIIDSNKIKYNNHFTINKTTYIKAVAYADNAVTSPSFTGYYILAIRSGGAWYKDLNGNGLIDAASIKLNAIPLSLSDSLVVCPDSIVFENPFKKSDFIAVTASDISVEDSMISLTLEDEFAGSLNISTAFDEDFFGRFYGQYYSTEKFRINDSVAPVVIKAIYGPGIIYRSGDSLTRDFDTLKVFFSESLSSSCITNSKVRFFDLYNKTKGRYNFNLSVHEVYQSSAIFIVNEIEGISYPKNGDSIRIIVEDSIADLNGNVVQTVEDNRYCNLEVRSVLVEPSIKVQTPVNIEKNDLPSVLKGPDISFEKGVPVLIDFLIDLPDDIVQKLDVQIRIYDQLGHLVASCIDISSKGISNIEVSLLEGDRTRLVTIWDGTNSSGRLVSSGTYLMDLKYVKSDGKSWDDKRFFVGIKK